VPASIRIIFTIGHSTRSFDEFVAMLSAHEVKAVADVRRFPASRRHSHFNRESMASALDMHDIEYRWFEDLGGRRTPLPLDESHNTAWRVDAFRGYADYMQTPEFAHALATLESFSLGRPVAIMCAEALEWRCHRRLIADALAARGWTVRHIHSADPAATTDHLLPDFARITNGRLTYPPPASPPDLFSSP
jgi:uncharacterized protein (DUF488 family)